MNQQQTYTSCIRRVSIFALVALIVAACTESPTPNVTPTVDLTILVTNTSAETVEGARVYLFPFETQYNNYLSDNPEGNENITPSLSADDIGITNGSGEVLFDKRDLDGNSYASGNTWFHRPNSIYVRVEAPDGMTTLTNDQGLFKISFDELESGEQIAEFVEIEVQ